jgi:hypothetical protein
MLPQMYIGLPVKYPLFLSDFSKTLIFSADYRKKCSNNKFYATLSSENRDIACGQRQTDRQTDRRTDGRTGKRYEANSRFSQFLLKRLKKDILFYDLHFFLLVFGGYSTC